MTDTEQLVGRFHRNLAGWLVARRAVAAVTLWAFLWGTAVLILRVAAGTSADTLAWGGLGVPLAVGIAAFVALRRLPDRVAVRALLDRHANCGGLLMAGAECDLGGWRTAMPAVEAPRLRWRAGRPLGLLAVAVGYVVVGFLLPPRVTAFAHASTLDVSRDADRLTEQVRVLKEEKYLEPERADELRKKLDQVRKEASGSEPAKTLEALDHLADVVKQAARKAAESTARQANALGQVEAAAGAMQSLAADLEGSVASEMMDELSRLARKAAAESEALDSELDGDLGASVKAGKLSADQLAKLADAAKAGQGSLRKQAKRLFDSRLLDGDQLKACEGGKCDPKALADYLKKTGCKGGLCDAMGNLPGRGGVNEGPGTAGLQFGDASDPTGAKFREETLPPSEFATLKDSQLVGVGRATPQKDPMAGPPSTGALQGAAAGGGSANAPIVLPQHRGAVGRYFDRPAK